jgi:hypothetical protein
MREQITNAATRDAHELMLLAGSVLKKNAELARLRQSLLAIAERAETLMLPEEMHEAMDDIAAMARAALDGEVDAWAAS